MEKRRKSGYLYLLENFRGIFAATGSEFRNLNYVKLRIKNKKVNFQEKLPKGSSIAP